MKRILFLTPQLPYPPHQGAALRNFGLINGLANRGHRITLLSLLEPDQPQVEDTPLVDLCDPAVAVPMPIREPVDRFRDLLIGHADMARRCWSLLFQATLRDLLDRHPFDVIHIEGIEMTPYLPTIKHSAPDTMLIYDAHNAEYALQRRIAAQDLRTVARWPLAFYSLIQTKRLARLEAETCHMVNHVLACSGADADKLRELPHQTPITVVPNAINAQDYHVAGQSSAPIVHPALVFTGKMDYRPNIDAALWFANDIFPLIRQKIPEAHFTIVGQKPHPRLDVLRGYPGITLTGFVPDIRPYVRAADVYVAPLRMGSGTRLKLLEAMAMNRAVVSTRLGAEGFEVRDGYHLYVADTPEDFAKSVVRLLRDENHRLELGFNAAKLVRETYDWSVIIPQIEAVYGEPEPVKNTGQPS